MPGLNYILSDTGAEIFTQPYQVQVFGADFSTTAGSYGLRGEFAYTFPDENTDSLFSVPCQQLEYTLGIDREWGNFSLIVQYVGKYIFDFTKENGLQNVLTQEVSRWNHMLFSQQEEWNHKTNVTPVLPNSKFHSKDGKRRIEKTCPAYNGPAYTRNRLDGWGNETSGNEAEYFKCDGSTTHFGNWN